jgi:RNA polymerase I-specific transcription initiation factor RRN3
MGGALRDTGLEFDDEKLTHVEACFPFDPFQLPTAKRWLDLKDNYVSWQPIPLLDGEGEEDSDEEGDDDDDSDDDSEAGESRLVSSFQEDTATDDEEGYDG